MDLQNLAYALVQVAHNFGAAAVVGGAVAGLALLHAGAALPRRLGWLVLAGWATQVASGAGFGAVSYASYGRFPDLHGVAVVALGLKMVCAASGFVLAAAYLKFADKWSVARSRIAWAGLVAVSVAALSAAAFLRWFS